MRAFKLLSGILAASLMITTLPAQASSVAEEVTETNQEIDSDTIGTSYTGSATVKFNQEASFVVKVPKNIVLDTDGAGKYAVGVKGQIPSKSVVKIVPEKTITMKAVKGVAKDVVADVTQDKVIWTPEEVTKEAFTESMNNTIQMREIDYANFEGTLNFGISLKKAKPFAIEYELEDDVTVDGENPASWVSGEETPLAPAVKEGYEFGGWYSDSNFKNKVESLGQLDSDTTLYPKFYRTIHYNLNGGELTGEYAEVAVYGKNSELPIPAKEGYRFVGWYTTPEFAEGTKVTTTEGLGEDAALYAKFEASQYSITYDLQGGDAASNSVNPTAWRVEDGVITLDEPTKEYAKFLGWYDNSEFSGEPIESVSGLTADLKLYAKWESFAVSFEELEDWTTKIDKTNKTVTLSRYNGTSADVIVYPAYTINGKNYATIINQQGSVNGVFQSNKTLQTVVFKDGVKIAGGCNSMFKDCNLLSSVIFGNVDTSEVASMNYMFYGCNKLTRIDWGSFDTSNVTGMSYTFCLCGVTELDLSNFNTSKVTTMEKMFERCYGLTELDLSNFNTPKVTTMSGMFDDCRYLTKLNLSGFTNSSVIGMCEMFSGCAALTELNLSNFNTSNVTDMYRVFYGCSNLTALDLRSFDTSKVTRMNGMFKYCGKLTSISVSSKFKTASNNDDMFYNCGTNKVTVV